MSEIEVQRYDMWDYARHPKGMAVMHADIAPLLAELATLRADVTELRERTRRRDAVEEPPPRGVYVWALVEGSGPDYFAVGVIPEGLDSWWVDGEQAEVRAWWPLPEVGE